MCPHTKGTQQMYLCKSIRHNHLSPGDAPTRNIKGEVWPKLLSSERTVRPGEESSAEEEWAILAR